jgi:hypothetical protein
VEKTSVEPVGIEPVAGLESVTVVEVIATTVTVAVGNPATLDEASMPTVTPVKEELENVKTLDPSEVAVVAVLAVLIPKTILSEVAIAPVVWEDNVS